MDTDRTDAVRKLEQYFQSIRGVVPIIDKAKGRIDQFPVQMLDSEIELLLRDFPKIVPPFRMQQFYSYSQENVRYFDSGGIRAYLSGVLGTLQLAMEDPADAPLIQVLDFQFVHSADLRKIMRRDYGEALRAFNARCWKSVIVLSGGLIEAALADLLLNNKELALCVESAPKNREIARWGLDDLIAVSIELELVAPAATKLSNPIRKFRNLIHPRNELKNKLHFGPEEARIALQVLNIVHRSLSN